MIADDVDAFERKMQGHRTDIEVQRAGCRALDRKFGHWAVNHSLLKDNRVQRSVEQACRAVVEGMRVHAKKHIVQEAGTAVLQCLQIDGPLREPAWKAGALTAVANAMRSFAASPSVQKNGCNFVYHLFYAHEHWQPACDRLEQAIESHSLPVDLIVTAMRAHPDAQEDACDALTVILKYGHWATIETAIREGVLDVLAARNDYHPEHSPLHFKAAVVLECIVTYEGKTAVRQALLQATRLDQANQIKAAGRRWLRAVYDDNSHIHRFFSDLGEALDALTMIPEEESTGYG